MRTKPPVAMSQGNRPAKLNLKTEGEMAAEIMLDSTVTEMSVTGMSSMYRAAGRVAKVHRHISMWESDQTMKNIMDKHGLHPNIIEIFEAEVVNDVGVSVMPHIGHADLFDIYVAGRDVVWGDIAGVVRQIGSAIGYMHAHGVAHGDLKLENIMYDRVAEKYTLIDFGGVGDASGFVSRCMTELYISPEVVLVGKASKKSDIWALGVICALLSGWRGTRSDLYEASISTRPASEALGIEAPNWVKGMIDAAIRIKPGDRCEISDIIDNASI